MLGLLLGLLAGAVPSAAADKAYCVKVDYSAVSTLVNSKKITLLVNVGTCSGVSVTAAGVAIPASYNAGTGLATVNTTATDLVVTALNQTTAGTGAVTKATLYNNYHWAYSLTVDDNRATAFSVAKPLLDAKGWAAGSSVVASWVGNGSNYMTWANIQALRASGWEVYNHTYTHPNLSCSNFVSEFSNNQSAFQTNLPGYNVTHIVYPYEVSTPTTCSGFPPSYLLSGEVAGSGYNYVDTALASNYLAKRSGLYGTDTTSLKSTASSAAADSRCTWVITITHGVAAGSGTIQDSYSTNGDALGGLLNYLYTTWGAGGSKTLWFAPSGEVMDYLFTRDKAVASACAMPSPTQSASPTVARTATASITHTRTATGTASPSPTASASASATPTPSATSTATAQAPTATRTVTPSATPTSTATPSITAAASASASSTPDASATASATATALAATSTPTFSPTADASASPSSTPNASATFSATATTTAQAATFTSTATSSATATAQAATSTPTFSPSADASASVSSTPSASATFSASATATAQAATFTSTATASPTAEASASVSSTPHATFTFSATATATVPSATPSVSPTSTLRGTYSFTCSPSATFTCSPRSSASATSTCTFTPTSVPASGGAGLAILASYPYPNPGPTGLILKLSAHADHVRLTVYSQAYTLVGVWDLGQGKAGWNTFALPAAWQRLARGMYYWKVTAQAGGQSATSSTIKAYK